MSNKNEQGVAHLGLIVVIVLVIAIVAFAFWRVQEQTTEPETTEPTTSEESDAIENESDLEAAEEELQQTDFDGELNVEELDATLE